MDKEETDIEWRRILWAKQPFPDNYVSGRFLKKLQSQPSTTLPTLQALIIYSLPLAQQLSITLLFVGVFLHLQQGTVSAEVLVLASAATIVLCASTTSKGNSSTLKKSKPLAQPLSYALLGLVVFSLSPLLKTLTEATTGDSIAALSTALFSLSFILADYRSPKNDKLISTQLPATLSLNASLCASIVLASRLDNPIQAFALILTSMCLFAFLPRWVRQNIPSRPSSPKFAILYTLLLTLTSSSLLLPFTTTAGIINILTAIFLCIICPAWMRRAQNWKVGRRGPWDVGVPKLRTRMEAY